DDMETAPDGVDVVGGDPEYSHRSLPFTRDLQVKITQSLILFKDFGPIQSYMELKQQMMDSPHLRTPFGLRQFAGRNKTVIPVVIGRGFARVTVLDDEPVYQYPGGAASQPSSVGKE
ncbi:MAG: hypothetical protein V1758_10160, partial [Pseudomonadota bacterium]